VPELLTTGFDTLTVRDAEAVSLRESGELCVPAESVSLPLDSVRDEEKDSEFVPDGLLDKDGTSLKLNEYDRETSNV
jgi:hypothetical protein